MRDPIRLRFTGRVRCSCNIPGASVLQTNANEIKHSPLPVSVNLFL